MLGSMPSDASAHFEILRGVVQLVTIDVVNDLSPSKASTELLLGRDAMLVGVTSNVSKVMADSDPHQHVAVRREAATSAPIVVLDSLAHRAWCGLAHQPAG